MRRQGRHLGGARPFELRVVPGEVDGKPMLVGVREELDAITQMRDLKRDGKTLMQIRDAMRASGFNVSHESVRQLIRRGWGAPEGWPKTAVGPQLAV